jgi:hypothetical protein
MAIPPFLVEKAAGIEIADALSAAQSRKLDGRAMAAFCALYRRIAIARLLSTGSSNDFLTWLAMGAQAFLHWLEGVPEEAKLGRLSEPFLDAVACGASDLAAGIARSAATTWRTGEEYEDDFLYFRFLMSYFGLRSDAKETLPLLERYEALAAGNDPRADVCRALFARDQERFDEAIEALVQHWQEKTREADERGMLSPDDAATTAHVSVELLALLRLATAAGLATGIDHPLAPSIARRTDRFRPPAPDAWRTFPSYRTLT